MSTTTAVTVPARRTKKGLLSTSVQAMEDVVGETGVTISATMKAMRHGSNAMEIAMRESVISSIEDLLTTKAEAFARLQALGYDRAEFTTMLAEYQA
jgi:hypothetical protein